MLRIGCHLSCTKGFLAMGKEVIRINANTFQFFLRNPRGGAVKPLDTTDVEAYCQYAIENDLGKILGHAPYTVNPCAEKENLREFARNTIKDDLMRLENIPGSMYTFHPGSHVKQGVSVGVALIAELLNDVLQPTQKTTVLLETMSGKGSEIGGNFEELRDIIAEVELQGHLGVCLDTCHVFDAGYDIADSLERVLEEFDNVIGLDKLKAIHLNDSKNTLGSRKDRHEKIGEGQIGLPSFERIINHPMLSSLPFYLETPNDIEGYKREIKVLREL